MSWEKWDDTTRTVTTFADTGEQMSTRPYTAAESQNADEVAAIERDDRNRSTIVGQAETAMAANSDYISLASPTNAQVAAQVKALTRQNNKVIRLALGKLDGTD